MTWTTNRNNLDPAVANYAYSDNPLPCKNRGASGWWIWADENNNVLARLMSQPEVIYLNDEEDTESERILGYCYDASDLIKTMTEIKNGLVSNT